LSIPYLSIIDEDSNTYNFESDFWIRGIGWQTSRNVNNKSFAAGGKDISDSFLQARTVEIEGSLRADSLAALETKVRNLQKACLKGGSLYVSDDMVSRYLTVSNAQIDELYTGNYRMEKGLNISFLVEYPFWQSNTLTEDANIISSAPETFYVDNSDSDFLVFPIITIEADQGSDVPNIKLQNKTDGGMILEYDDPLFVIGSTVVINCFNGTVQRDNANSIENLTTAKFLRLQNANNTIEYTGNDCTITYSWRKIYL